MLKCAKAVAVHIACQAEQCPSSPLPEVKLSRLGGLWQQPQQLQPQRHHTHSYHHDLQQQWQQQQRWEVLVSGAQQLAGPPLMCQRAAVRRLGPAR